jgi:hypothetical protein
MQFLISRTSLHDDSKKPCKESCEITIPYYDRRFFKSFEEHDTKLKVKWLDKGTEHKVLPHGGISRRMGDKNAWAIEIESLDDIVRLYNKYGDLVITTRIFSEDQPEIEIYDTYRE